MAVWLSGSPAGHCLCVWWARRFGSGRHAWNMCGRNVGEFVPAQMEASCIQSDSWAVVSKTIWLWVSRPLSVHMIHGSSQGLMLVIGVSKCRGIHWCSNILLLYHLPGKVLGQPHLWCGVSVDPKHTHPPRLRHLKIVKMSWTFIPFAKRTSWTGVPSSNTRSWKGDQSLNRLRMRWRLLVTVNCGPALHQFHGPCLWQETLQAITGGDRSKVILNIGRALGKWHGWTKHWKCFCDSRPQESFLTSCFCQITRSFEADNSGSLTRTGSQIQ